MKNVFVIAAIVMLAGCSLFKSETPRIDYKSAQLAKPLEVPPDLLHPTTDDQYTVPAAGGVGGTAAARALLDKSANGSVTLVLNEDTPLRAWRRVGLALDRSKDGFSIDKRDRINKSYQVHYHDPDAAPKKPGFFARLFGAKTQPVPETSYQIVVAPQDDNKGSKVTLLTEAGTPETADKATPVLQLLQEQLQ